MKYIVIDMSFIFQWTRFSKDILNNFLLQIFAVHQCNQFNRNQSKAPFNWAVSLKKIVTIYIYIYIYTYIYYAAGG